MGHELAPSVKPFRYRHGGTVAYVGSDQAGRPLLCLPQPVLPIHGGPPPHAAVRRNLIGTSAVLNALHETNAAARMLTELGFAEALTGNPICQRGARPAKVMQLVHRVIMEPL